jgi:hypothetical protein
MLRVVVVLVGLTSVERGGWFRKMNRKSGLTKFGWHFAPAGGSVFYDQKVCRSFVFQKLRMSRSSRYCLGFGTAG